MKESRGRITFLRRVIRGSSDRSYGIHVAELAGIPKAVTKRASEILCVLEKESAQATNFLEGVKATKTGAAAPKGQSTFFDFVSPKLSKTEEDVLEELHQLRPEALTPLEALQKLSKWSEDLGKDS